MQEKTFLQMKAYDIIKNDILSGELQPDVLYSESKMSAKIGISRTPIREALQCLSQDGYITVVPSKGFMIRQLNEKDMLESIQVRCAIEGFCTFFVSAELQTEKGQAFLREMHRSLEQMEQTMHAENGLDEFIRSDHQFHLCLVNYVHNEEFSNLFQRLMYSIQLTSKKALAMEGRIEGTFREHQEYLRLLENGSTAEAYKCMIEHLKMPLNMNIPAKSNL